MYVTRAVNVTDKMLHFQSVFEIITLSQNTQI